MAGKSSSARAGQIEKAAGGKVPAPGAQSRSAAPTEASATQLDRLIHERTRLAIVSALAASPSLTFSELKELLRASDGNLSVHARKLEDAGYVALTKSFAGRTPRTEYRLTPSGRRALEKYLNHMEALIHAARKG